ncbi:MAG: hypothetical protein Q4B65_01785 [Candidatus Saccharibacteria bacterium]|nr:hypothetical protein [Candidatus Saccharibacteria bacterium]
MAIKQFDVIICGNRARLEGAHFHSGSIPYKDDYPKVEIDVGRPVGILYLTFRDDEVEVHNENVFVGNFKWDQKTPEFSRTTISIPTGSF